MTARIAFRIEDGIARLTFDNPAARNAVDLQFCEEWAQAAIACSIDETLKAILIEAKGEMFSVGGDLGAFLAHADGMDSYIARCVAQFHAGIRALAHAPAPVVLALNGTAAGGAFSLVCGADIVIARRSAKLASGYTRSGLTPDGGLTWLLPRLVGPRRAFAIMALNRPIPADEALTLGLVTQVVEDDALEAEVERTLATLAAMPPGVLGDLKRLLDRGLANTFTDQLDEEARIMPRRAANPDTAERLRAFLKR